MVVAHTDCWRKQKKKKKRKATTVETMMVLLVVVAEHLYSNEHGCVQFERCDARRVPLLVLRVYK